ncbi:3-methyladenine DNA glycosylase [Mycolicibacter nonchromogenicus]|uniref:DNA-3-methyladenine glycosylase II n=1 Tax=Mycolicibacter nonchromogenicus TaxID=1782 RepID=A0A1X1Z9J9_MYCNO|nr:3-methyladenine DNA glycosylase [Mycolicibacter nonchromogenicus]
MSNSLCRSITFPGPVSLALALGPLRRGPGDPCLQVVDGAVWRTSLMPSGPLTARLVQTAPNVVDCVAWGAGAAEFLEGAPGLVGVHDDATDFAPTDPTVLAAHRRVPQLRLGRTGRVLEALIPAVLEQRVPGVDAFRAWRLLVTEFGSPAPGPAPARMRVPPSAHTWRTIPSWKFHRANVDGGRARTIVGCAGRADALERLGARPAAEARVALMSLPGVGEWTAAETTQRAFGDADALSVGDYHLATMIGRTLLGLPLDATFTDEAMVELMEPMRPHRHRVVRLLIESGLAVSPRRGPRLALQRISSL